MKEPPVGFGWFLMFWIALDELVNSPYGDLAPILAVGKCKSSEFGLCCDRVDFVDFPIATTDWAVVLILRTVRRIDSIFRDRHRTSVFDANAGSAGLPAPILYPVGRLCLLVRL